MPTQTNEFAIEESTGVPRRTIRAAVECMTAIPTGEAYSVTTQSGHEYTVTVDGEPTCSCPDFQHRLPADGEATCKHIRRVLMGQGKLPVPGHVLDRSAVDYLLGQHVDGVTRVVPHGRGGVEAAAGDERPGDCECWANDDGEQFPCVPCFVAGYDHAASVDLDRAQVGDVDDIAAERALVEQQARPHHHVEGE